MSTIIPADLGQIAYSVGRDLKRRQQLRVSHQDAVDELKRLQTDLQDTLSAQKLLGSVADERSERVLNYVTAVINKALTEVFPGRNLRIEMERKLHGGRYPHINVVLYENDQSRIMKLQSGTGLRQIVSFLYRVCLLEITGGRKLVIMDELLGGVHKDAIVIIQDLIRIFAEGGFQFVIVDYSIRERFGRNYLVSSNGGYSDITEITEDEELVLED